MICNSGEGFKLLEITRQVPGLLLVLGSFLPGGVLEEVSVHLVPGQLDVPHHAPPDEAVLDAQHVRILVGVGDADVCQLNVEVLVDLEHDSQNSLANLHC